MLFIKIYHAIGVAALGFTVWDLFTRHNSSAPLYFLVWGVYGFVFLGVMRQNIWCLRLSLLPISLVLLSMLSFTAYNLWAFIFSNLLYRDSPATIFIVAFHAAITIGPSLIALTQYWRHRTKIFQQRQKEFQVLAAYMSELSEQGYFVRWMRGLEYDLWYAVMEGPFRYGFLMIENKHIQELKRLSNLCGGWVIFDEENEDHYVPMKKWHELYARKIVKTRSE